MTGIPHAPGTGEELRLAVVMNGGVSLAVWIGGVTLEYGRLVAGDSAYGELQTLMDTTTRIDVICGTSAGGINGAYLAMALAYHEDRPLVEALRNLRMLWVKTGSIASLLRNPFESGANSVLDGDGFFYQALRDAFRPLKTDTPTCAKTRPLDLVITTTLLKGMQRDYSDDFGSPIVDVSHRGQFRFMRGQRDDRNDFKDADIADRLALAARSTASFPAAFEASFCPVNEKTADPVRPDMKDVVNFTSSQFVIDGGVLDNSPLDLALDSIYHQRAYGPVRRVLTFVVPDPGTTAVDAPKPEPAAIESPELLDVAIASLVQIPAVQSISTQLNQLRTYNEQAKGRRHSRTMLTKNNEPAAIDELAEKLFSTYRDQRIADAIEYILEEIGKGLVKKNNYGLGRRGRQEWLRWAIAEHRDDVPWIPTKAPKEGSGAEERSREEWRWGTRPVEHIAHLFLDIVIRTQEVADLLSVPLDLQAFWAAAYDLLERTERIRGLDKEYWRRESANVLTFLGDGRTATKRDTRASKWFSGVLKDWKTEVRSVESEGRGTPAFQAAGAIAHEIANNLLALRSMIFDLRRAKAPAVGEQDKDTVQCAEELDRLYGYFVRLDGETTEAVVRRLLAFEVTQDALGGRGTVIDQEVEFIEISARNLSTFGGPLGPAGKLAGLQLAHFGAFYKESWRANDWLWGRLDAVQRLVRLLLDPERLRIAAAKSGKRASDLAKDIETIAVATDDAGLRAELVRIFDDATRDRLKDELKFIDDRDTLIPEQLPIAVKVVSRRLEAEILAKELPLLAEAITNDKDQKCYMNEAATAFLSRYKNVAVNGAVPGHQLQDLFSLCALGSERLASEVGTDRLTTVATQAVAVAVSSVHNRKGLFALVGRLFAVLRAPSLLFYVFARNVTLSSPTAAAINGALFAAGLIIVGTALYEALFQEGPQYPTWLILCGAAGFVAPAAWAAIRWYQAAKRIGEIVTVLLLIGIYILFVGVFLVFFHVIKAPALSLTIWQNVAVGSLGLLVVGFALAVASAGGRR